MIAANDAPQYLSGQPIWNGANHWDGIMRTTNPGHAGICGHRGLRMVQSGAMRNGLGGTLSLWKSIHQQ